MSIICVGLHLLDMADLFPLRASIAQGYGTEKLKATVHMQIPHGHIFQVSRERLNAVILKCEASEFWYTLQLILAFLGRTQW